MTSPFRAGLSRSLRTVARLGAAAPLGSLLLPGIAITLVWPDRVEQALPLTWPGSGRSKAVAAALARLDSALASLPLLRCDAAAGLVTLAEAAELAAGSREPQLTHVLSRRPGPDLGRALGPVLGRAKVLRPEDPGEAEWEDSGSYPDGLEVTRIADELDLD